MAVSDDGLPTLLNHSRQPTFTAPHAAICWSPNLQPQIKSTFNMGAFIGRDSSESFQLPLHDPGFVTDEPSEDQPVVAWSGVRRRRQSRRLRPTCNQPRLQGQGRTTCGQLTDPLETYVKSAESTPRPLLSARQTP